MHGLHTLRYVVEAVDGWLTCSFSHASKREVSLDGRCIGEVAHDEHLNKLIMVGDEMENIVQA